MDTRLFEAAQTGNIKFLHGLLAENPYILHTIALTSQENPLHVSSIDGHVDVVKEILRLKPGSSKEINQDGFSPLHLASAIGHFEVVKELLKVDPILCRLEGRNKWTPLHYAASGGRVDIIQEMLLACPESIQDVNVQKETALHLAVKNSQFEATNLMVKWVIEYKKDEVLNMKDELDNSVLHLAVWRKHRQVVEWILSYSGADAIGGLVNAVNRSGLTALNVLLIFPSEAGDREMEEILRNAGAKRAKDIIMSLSSVPPFEKSDNNQAGDPTPLDLSPDNLVNYFKFKRGRDSPSDARTALLVIAVLVTTATFQAGLNPPGTVWQDTGTTGLTHKAGRSILGSYDSVMYLFFMLFNTTGFGVSIYVISILISSFPLRWEFEVCIIALHFTYTTAITFMAPKRMAFPLMVFSIVFPLFVPFIAKLVRRLVMKVRPSLTYLNQKFI
ncbi:ankyrin repeat-containing protein BDA1-like [Ziziphus jujuba]|uniref:Ankyrin repeat-containing protein BDA1-like n=1 Tax=Ziziphus jujuba TaxID=326968 RepID=A0ABM4AFB6_ZIZJJ|nr:ankyrin repeat-containing protein BDA1-like [Ziziphus jujuba]